MYNKIVEFEVFCGRFEGETGNLEDCVPRSKVVRFGNYNQTSVDLYDTMDTYMFCLADVARKKNVNEQMHDTSLVGRFHRGTPDDPQIIYCLDYL